MVERTRPIDFDSVQKPRSEASKVQLPHTSQAWKGQESGGAATCPTCWKQHPPSSTLFHIINYTHWARVLS
jgi:hypothetical protein